MKKEGSTGAQQVLHLGKERVGREGLEGRPQGEADHFYSKGLAG